MDQLNTIRSYIQIAYELEAALKRIDIPPASPEWRSYQFAFGQLINEVKSACYYMQGALEEVNELSAVTAKLKVCCGTTPPVFIDFEIPKSLPLTCPICHQVSEVDTCKNNDRDDAAIHYSATLDGDRCEGPCRRVLCPKCDRTEVNGENFCNECLVGMLIF